MRDLERKIEKLEHNNGTNDQYIEELEQHFDDLDLHMFERISIKVQLGLVKGEEIAKLLRRGAKKFNKEVKKECL